MLIEYTYRHRKNSKIEHGQEAQWPGVEILKIKKYTHPYSHTHVACRLRWKRQFGILIFDYYDIFQTSRHLSPNARKFSIPTASDCRQYSFRAIFLSCVFGCDTSFFIFLFSVFKLQIYKQQEAHKKQEQNNKQH